MQIIRDLYNLRTSHIGPRGTVATVGNYDGVHLGHQQLLTLVKSKASELDLPSVAIIFEPQPEEFFNRNHQQRLTSLREKILLFSHYGLKNLLVLPFNQQLAATSALQFITEVLVRRLRVEHLVIGDDFAFGRERGGNFLLLEEQAIKSRFQVTQLPTFKINGIRVSSSLIRNFLSSGDTDQAARFLGRPYRISGRVVAGNHLGHSLGFPTANIHLRQREVLLQGVYLVKVYDLTPKPLLGLANSGFRPTVAGKNQSFEVYIINFDANIYHKRITIEFCKKIRDERKFTSLAELQLQIKQDLALANVTGKNYD